MQVPCHHWTILAHIPVALNHYKKSIARLGKENQYMWNYGMCDSKLNNCIYKGLYSQCQVAGTEGLSVDRKSY